MYEQKFVKGRLVGHTWYEDGLLRYRVRTYDVNTSGDTWESVENLPRPQVLRYNHATGTKASAILVNTQIA